MKKIIAFLALASAIALLILGLINFKIYPFNDKNEPTPSNSPISKVKVQPFLSEDENYEENIQKGDNYAKKGYGTLAIQAYTLANKIYPGKSDPYKKIGLVYYNNQNYEKAIDNFSRGIEINSTDSESIILLSKAYLKENKSTEAEDLLKKYSDLYPDVKLQLAYTLIGSEKLQEGKTLIDEILSSTNIDEFTKNETLKLAKSFDGFDLSRGAPEVYLKTLLAKNLTQSNNYELAIPLLKNILTEKNNYRDAWILLGYSYLNTQKTYDAAEALKEALKLAPEMPETRYLLALANYYNNNLEDAIENMEVALQNDFEPKEEALSKLGEIYLQMENYEDAARTYDELIKIKQDDIDIFIKPVWIYLEHLNNYQEALKYADLAQTYHPTEAMSYNLIGWVKTKQGEFTEAKINFDKALNINPNLDAAYLNLGTWHEKQNQIEEAKQSYKKAYELGDGNSIANLAAIQYNNLIRNSQQ